LPVWRHDAQREKEAELVFRGQQYVRAIRLYQQKTRGLPPSIDVLVQGHYIRKKFKDPISNDDFDVIPAGAPQTTPSTPTQAGTISQQPSAQSNSERFVPGGMIGVRSKSKDDSIMLYQGRSHYNEWAFVYVLQQPGGPGGASGPARQRPGGIGGEPAGRRGGEGRGGFGPEIPPTSPNGPARGRLAGSALLASALPLR
jgi:hypothetical protein